MKIFQYKLLATDGEWTKEFLFFLQAKKGDLYYGLLSPTSEGKTSRHVSGISHIKSGDSLIKLGKGLPLNEYKGLHQLFVMSIGKQVFSSKDFGRPYSNKKIDGIITIDTRRFKQRVGIIGFLLEPADCKNIDHLPKTLKNVQFTILTQTTPWLVIAIYDAGTAIIKSNQPTMLPWEKTFLKMEMPNSEKGGNLVLIDGPSME
jgi:hypothetical protein